MTLGLAATLGACTDSKPPRGISSSDFNPFFTDASSAPPRAATPPGALAVGDCFDTDQFVPGASIDPGGVHAIACSEPHQHQVYAIEHDPDPPGAPYPGDAAMAEFADDVCLQDFPAAIGTEYLQSSLDYGSIRPNATTWATGERSVICAAHDADFAELTGSQLVTTTTSPPSSSGSSSSSTTTSLSAESG